MKREVFLSYDINAAGDYKNLYKWLDERDAAECGTCLARFDYTAATDDVIEFGYMLKDELESKVAFNEKTDRIYIIVADDGTRRGFIIGERNKAPWAGYAISKDAAENF